MRGKFIVLEGIDGSGTTTQSELLVSALRQDGIKASRTREPSDGPVGLLIRQVLTGKIVLPRGANESVEMDSRSGWSTMALLFAADRMDHVGREIEPALARGEWVISDRYVGSSLAYQSLTAPGEVVEALGWIANLNRFATKPDVTVVLDVPADAAEARRVSRGGETELYERTELQKKLAAFYEDLPRHLPEENVVMVSGVGSVEEVQARIRAVLPRSN